MITLSFTDDEAHIISSDSSMFREKLIKELSVIQSKAEATSPLRVMVREVYLTSKSHSPKIEAIKVLRDEVGIGHDLYPLKNAKDFVEKNIADLEEKLVKKDN